MKNVWSDVYPRKKGSQRVWRKFAQSEASDLKISHGQGFGDRRSGDRGAGEIFREVFDACQHKALPICKIVVIEEALRMLIGPNLLEESRRRSQKRCENGKKARSKEKNREALQKEVDKIKRLFERNGW